MINKAILFLNGDIPDKKIIDKYVKKDDFIISADSGEKLKKRGINPKTIIGDLDSMSVKNIEYFRKKGTEILKIAEQETNDFEKALKYLIKKSFKVIDVFGAVSSRADHTLNNLSVLKRYKSKMQIRFIGKKFEIMYLRNKSIVETKTGKIISLMAMPIAKKVTTEGLQYSLTNENLEFGIREGTLNKAVKDKLRITYKSGDILIFKEI